MKKMKRLVPFAMAIALTLSVIAGCSGNDPKTGESTVPTKATTATPAASNKPAKEVTLKIWGGVPAESGPDLVMEKFNKEFADKGISATYERFVNDDSGNLKLDTALLSGNDVDLFVSYSIPKLKQRVESGMAIDLTAYAQKDGFDFEKNFGPIVKNYYINELPYAMPTYAYKYSFMVNKDLFEANNIPVPTQWTLDEFRDIAAKLTKGSGTDKVYGAFLSLDTQLLPALITGTSTGGDYFFKNGKDQETDFDNPLYEKTLQTIVDMMLVDKSVVPYTDMVTQKLTATAMFVSGKAAISDAYWTVRDVKDVAKYPHDFETAFVTMPTVEAISREDSYISGGYMDYFSINSKSENKDAAWEFLKWYATSGMEPMIPFGRAPSYVNFDKNVVASAFSQGVEQLFDMESFKNEVLKPETQFQIQTITTKLPEISKVVKEEFEMAYIGKKDAKTALADAKKRSDEILKK